MDPIRELAARIAACTESVRVCAVELQGLYSVLKLLSEEESKMNEQYLNLVLERQKSAVEEIERELGPKKGFGLAITREIALSSLGDIPALVEEIQRLREESRQQALAELAQRPWEKGSQVEVVSTEGRVVMVSQLQFAVVADPSNGERCSECGGTFTPEEWDIRHTDAEGNDVHNHCCPLCKAHSLKG